MAETWLQRLPEVLISLSEKIKAGEILQEIQSQLFKDISFEQLLSEELIQYWNVHRVLACELDKKQQLSLEQSTLIWLPDLNQTVEKLTVLPPSYTPLCIFQLYLLYSFAQQYLAKPAHHQTAGNLRLSLKMYFQTASKARKNREWHATQAGLLVVFFNLYIVLHLIEVLTIYQPHEFTLAQANGIIKTHFDLIQLWHIKGKDELPQSGKSMICMPLDHMTRCLYDIVYQHAIEWNLVQECKNPLLFLQNQYKPAKIPRTVVQQSEEDEDDQEEIKLNKYEVEFLRASPKMRK